MGHRLPAEVVLYPRDALATAGEREGMIWTLEGSNDLNTNLVRFGAGRGVGEHVNDEVDVLFVGVSGSGFEEVEGEEHALDAERLVFVPKGVRRSTRGATENFAYLTVHRRRDSLWIRSWIRS
jgi:quercetin dioxygenase-like cupin family protein